MRNTPIPGEVKLNSSLDSRPGIFRFDDIHRVREMGGFVLTPHDPCLVDVLILDEEIDEMFIYRS